MFLYFYSMKKKSDIVNIYIGFPVKDFVYYLQYFEQKNSKSPKDPSD